MENLYSLTIFILFSLFTNSLFGTEIKSDKVKYGLYMDITKEIKCIESPNQSLFDADISIAIEIKKNIIKMINEKKNKEDILSMLKKKYKNDIDFNPNIKENIFLWIEPFFMLLISIFFIIKQTKFK